MNRIGPRLHADRPRVVSFGGGKGGAGRSTLCSEVARAVARHNHRILCVDASWACPTLNTFLHAAEPGFDFRYDPLTAIGEEGSHLADFIVETATRNVWMISLASGRRFPFVRPRLSADALLLQLHELDFDWVFIDLPPGLDPLNVGLFTLSDVPILVTSPEPASVRMSTQYLRSALYQAIGYHPDAIEVRDEILELLYGQPLRMNLDTLLADTHGLEATQRIVVEAARQFEPYVVVNLVREGAERDLGFVLAHAWHKELHIFPRVLTSVDYEDRRWFYNRRTTGLNPARADEALSKDIETLGKMLTEISLVDARFPRPVPDSPEAHPALRLGISPELGRNEVRQHCRRLWEGYRREKTIGLVFGDPDQQQHITESLEALYREVLTMPADSFGSPSGTSRPTPTPAPRPLGGGSLGESTSSVAESAAKHPTNAAGAAPPPDGRPPHQAPAAGAATPPSVSAEPDAAPTPAEPAEPAASTGRPNRRPGDVIANLRRDAGISLQELSLRTHIGIKYLAAIEDTDLEVLPRRVYLRGYLREIARIFDVPAEPLIRKYFEYLNAEA